MISLLYFSERTYGKIRYFEANRCINTKQVRQYNRDLITCDEIVSFDSGLFDMREMASLEEILSSGTEQILAVIMRPDPKPNSDLQKQEGFVFCGYDLVDDYKLRGGISIDLLREPYRIRIDCYLPRSSFNTACP